MKPKPPANNKSLNAQLLEFSGMAFEMLVIIGIFVLLGRFIDKKITLEIPLFTIVLCIVGLAASFYQIFRRLQKNK